MAVAQPAVRKLVVLRGPVDVARQAAEDVRALRRGLVGVLVAQAQLVGDLVRVLDGPGARRPGALVHVMARAHQVDGQMRLVVGADALQGDMQTVAVGQGVPRVVEVAPHTLLRPAPGVVGVMRARTVLPQRHPHGEIGVRRLAHGEAPLVEAGAHHIARGAVEPHPGRRPRGTVDGGLPAQVVQALGAGGGLPGGVVQVLLRRLLVRVELLVLLRLVAVLLVRLLTGLMSGRPLRLGGGRRLMSRPVNGGTGGVGGVGARGVIRGDLEGVAVVRRRSGVLGGPRVLVGPGGDPVEVAGGLGGDGRPGQLLPQRARAFVVRQMGGQLRADVLDPA